MLQQVTTIEQQFSNEQPIATIVVSRTNITYEKRATGCFTSYAELENWVLIDTFGRSVNRKDGFFEDKEVAFETFERYFFRSAKQRKHLPNSKTIYLMLQREILITHPH